MRRRITYANVAATLALVLSMTGGALAAKHYLINSTKQINPKVLKKLKGAAGKKGAAGAAGAPGKEGAPGKNGLNGERGPSHAYSVNSGTSVLEFPTTASAPLQVSALALPAGDYAITGKVLVNNNSGVADVSCELLAGGSVADPGFEVITLAEAAPGDRGDIVLTGTAALASAGAAEMICKSSSKSGNYLGRSITAVQVGGIG